MTQAEKSHIDDKEKVNTQASLFPDVPAFKNFEMLIEFIFAGKARLSIKSRKTQKHFTFRIYRISDTDIFAVSFLGGNGHYHYLGSIFDRKVFNKTRKTCSYCLYHPAFEAFKWFWKKLNGYGKIPQDVEVYHEKRCGMCARRLTDPVSIQEGYGPECRNKRLRRPFTSDKGRL